MTDQMKADVDECRREFEAFCVETDMTPNDFAWIIWQAARPSPVKINLEECVRAIDPNAFAYEGKEVEHAGDKARRARARVQAKAVADSIIKQGGVISYE